MLTRLASTRPPLLFPGPLPPPHTASDCRLSAQFASLASPTPPASAPPPPTTTTTLPLPTQLNELSKRRLSVSVTSARRSRWLFAPHRVALTRDLDSPCISPTINKTSQSWQINLLANSTRPPGLSLLLMSRLLCSFLRRLLPSRLSGWKEALGCRSFTIETLCGAGDIQSLVAQTDEINIQQLKSCSLQINALDTHLGGPSSG